MLIIGGALIGEDAHTTVDPWPNGLAVFDLSTLNWTNGTYNHSAEAYEQPSVVKQLYLQR